MKEIHFIDRLPFGQSVRKSGSFRDDPVLPMAIIKDGSDRYESAKPYNLALDTGYDGEIISSEEFLISQFNLFITGSAPDHCRLNSNRKVTVVAPGFSVPQDLDCYRADLLIFSNREDYRLTPIRIELDVGVTIHPQRPSPLAGNRLFEASGIKILLNYD